MDASEVTRIVEANISSIKKMMGLERWDITVHVGYLEGSSGKCEPDFAYKSALISIDPEEHSDEAEVLEKLWHEMIHILDTPYEAYRGAVEKLISAEEFEALDVIFQIAAEQTRWNIQYMLQHGFKVIGRRE